MKYITHKNVGNLFYSYFSYYFNKPTDYSIGNRFSQCYYSKTIPPLANCFNPLNYFSGLKIINTYYRVHIPNTNAIIIQSVFLARCGYNPQLNGGAGRYTGCVSEFFKRSLCRFTPV